jgi:hypothetical protein
LHRLVLAVVGCVILTYAALVVAFVDLPTALVCERGPTKNVEISSTAAGGYFKERQVGPA